MFFGKDNTWIIIAAVVFLLFSMNNKCDGPGICK